MKPTIGCLIVLFTLTRPATAALDFLVVDSGKPGATLVVISSEAAAGTAAVRQLQQYKPQRGRLVLARSRPDFQAPENLAGWEIAPDSAALADRFPDAHELVLTEDEEAHSFDKHFEGDTVRGSGSASALVLTALRGLESDIAGKSWEALPVPDQNRRIVVTTHARVNMEGGLRPVIREREFRTAAAAMLRHLKIVDPGDEKPLIFAAARPGKIRVAVYDGPGALNGVGRGPAWLRSRLANNADLLPELVDGRDIRDGVLEQVDVLVIGGGKVTPQSQGLGEDGRKRVVKFVRNGGGFVGICAGAYLASNGSGKWNHLELLPVETVGTDLDCKTPLVWSVGPLGGARVEAADLNGGPIFKPLESASDPITVWARFERNETSKQRGETPLGGTPAVISGTFGKGKVLLSSTHCERPPSPASIFPEMVRWSARNASGRSGGPLKD